jgi:hypothetical protein
MRNIALLLLAVCLGMTARAWSAPITDNFNDGNFTANPAWTPHGNGNWDASTGVLLQNAAAQGDLGTTPRTIQLDSVVTGSSFTMQTDLRIDSPDGALGVNSVGIAFRMQSPTQMYVVNIFPDYAPSNGELRVTKINGVSRTTVGSVQNMGFTPGETWSTMSLSVVDNAFTITVSNGANTPYTYTVTDNTSPYSNGGVGLFSETYYDNAIGLFDNVAVSLPEPTGAVLSMLAITALSARRRRAL